MMKTFYLICISAVMLTVGCSKDNTMNPVQGTSINGLKASAVGDVVGKVMCGYQGWFSCAGDGSPIGGWSHYCNSGTPGPGNFLLPAWPDVRDFTSTYQTAFANLGNGSPAELFSPWDQQTVNTQVQWLQQYGIDGMALQRFSSWTTSGSTKKNQVDGIATRMMNACQTYGKKFYIMYDGHATDAIDVDWTNTIKGSLNLLASSAYAKQNGKPVVCMWGIGYTDRGAAADWLNKINWFKAQGCYVIGGVPYTWRTNSDYATYSAVYNALNMISPWMVGVISDNNRSDVVRANNNVGDVSYCSSHGIDYQPCVLPGGGSQRAHGDFMWHQFYNMITLPCQGIYISMFDEFNEGNQIAKTAENAFMIPAGSSFETLDMDGTACSSDYYLRLTGDGAKMFKGQIALTTTRPTPYYPVSTGVTFYQNNNYSGTAGQVLAKGTYTMAQLVAKGCPNDWASSVKVPSGWTVIIYADDNFTGTSWTKTADIPDFTTLNPNANDKMSSVKIQ